MSNVVEYNRAQDIRYPFSDVFDKHGRHMFISFVVTYLSDGDPFSPKYDTVTIDRYHYPRHNESNYNVTIDQILDSIALLFGTQYTSVKMRINKIPIGNSSAPRTSEDLSIDISEYKVIHNE